MLAVTRTYCFATISQVVDCNPIPKLRQYPSCKRALAALLFDRQAVDAKIHFGPLL